MDEYARVSYRVGINWLTNLGFSHIKLAAEYSIICISKKILPT